MSSQARCRPSWKKWTKKRYKKWKARVMMVPKDILAIINDSGGDTCCFEGQVTGRERLLSEAYPYSQQSIIDVVRQRKEDMATPVIEHDGTETTILAQSMKAYNAAKRTPNNFPPLGSGHPINIAYEDPDTGKTVIIPTEATVVNYKKSPEAQKASDDLAEA